jgi:hypothetical protein
MLSQVLLHPPTNEGAVYMKIYKYNNEPEAQKIKALLEAENIPCELHSFETGAFDGVFRGQIGMGEVIVLDEFSNKAKEIVDKFISEQKDEDNKAKDDWKKICLLEESAKCDRPIICAKICIISAIIGILLWYFLKNTDMGIIFGSLFALLVPFATLMTLISARKAKKELNKLRRSKGARSGNSTP